MAVRRRDFFIKSPSLIRDGRTASGSWDTGEPPPGDMLRIIAADYTGNEAQEGRDLLIIIR